MGLGNRQNQHSFSKVPQANMARSRFDRSFGVKDTMNFDYLIPIFMDEVLPGDTKRVNLKHFIRLAPQVVPLLDNLYIDFYWFFVPNRLVWTNWEKQMGAQTNPGDSTDYLTPVVAAPAGTGFVNGSIYDHAGIPTQVEGLTVSSLAFRAYNLIWNEWFRDENLQTSVSVPKGDGPDTASTFVLLKGGKKHDYFTSSLPWPQKGNPVTLPMATTAPIIRNPTLANQVAWQGYEATTNNLAVNSNVLTGAVGGVNGRTTNSTQTVNGLMFDPRGSLVADLSVSTAVTINQIRQSFMMQSILELDARGGTRYTEILKAHFNVISPDFRLQRPEFLGSATSKIQQHPIAQTSETTATSPQGNLAAFSTSHEGGSRLGFTKSFVEHGWVIGLAKARADITYQYGLNKKWSRRTRWDYFWPKLQEAGEQVVTNGEIYALGTIADLAAFGYQERYAEYRYSPSEIRGQFRSNYAQSLDIWHMAEEYGSAPALNATFIQSSTPIQRSLVLPDPEYPALLCDFWFDYIDTRPIMTYGVPASLGRF